MRMWGVNSVARRVAVSSSSVRAACQSVVSGEGEEERRRGDFHDIQFFRR
jgi:hypothetical protein